MNPQNIKELPKSLLEKAIVIATVAHDGQVDRSGHPYILHPLRVMTRGKTIEERVAGVLHDTVEDTTVTLEDLKAYGIPHHIVEAISFLTRKEEGDSKELYSDFIGRILNNPIAMKVKLNDLEDNTDPNRAVGMGKDHASMMKKYNKAKQRILDRLIENTLK